MPVGYCKLCGEVSELKDSHILPNAFFKKILREGNGKAISFNSNDDHGFIQHSSESWSEFMLCNNCEKYLNEKYERKSIATIRGNLSSISITKHNPGISFKNIDQQKLQLFIVSILWRAAVSSHKVYKKVYIPDHWREEIRVSLLKNKKVRDSLVNIRLTRLIDKTEGGFSSSTLKRFLISPSSQVDGGRTVVSFLMEGIFVKVFLPGIQRKKRNRLGIVVPNKNILFIPYQNIFDIPVLEQLIISGYGKFATGKCTNKIKRDFGQHPTL